MSYTSLLNIGNNNSENGSMDFISSMPAWLFTSSDTWTCPEDGLYRLICIGKGGDGGNGFAYNNNTDSSIKSYYMYDSSGGAGGGVAIGEQQLTSGMSLTIELNDKYSSINGTALKATAGENGYGAGINTYGSAISSLPSTPAVGTASGTWLKYGFKGQTPEIGTITNVNGTTENSYYVGKVSRGGNIGCFMFLPTCDNINGVSIIPSSYIDDGRVCTAYDKTIGTNTSTIHKLTFDEVPDKYKNAVVPRGAYTGGGGMGAASCIMIYTSYSVREYEYCNIVGKGGKGGPGAVLIQRIK